MTESLAIELVLALYSASYRSPEKPATRVISVQNGRTPKPPKKTRSLAQGTGATTNTLAPIIAQVVKPTTEPILPKSVSIPKPGTLDSPGFILALRHAGMRRNAAGVLVRHPLLILQDEK